MLVRLIFALACTSVAGANADGSGGEQQVEIKGDRIGQLTSLSNAGGHVTTWTNHNARNQPGRVVDPNNVATDFSYADNGNLLTATLRLATGDRTTAYNYNNDRQLVDVSHPTGRVDRFRYNAAGRLTKIGNAAGAFQTRSFDLASREEIWQSARHVPGLSAGLPVAVSSGNFRQTRVKDCFGRTCDVIGNAGQQVTLGYDGNGNLVSRTDAELRTTTYAYDAQNRITRVDAPDGGVTHYRCDAQGNLVEVQDPRNLVTQYTYDGFGLMLSRSSPDTGLTNYTYDAAGRLSTESLANGRVISYTWDALVRMTSRTSGASTESYTYDTGTFGVGRLHRATSGVGSVTYAYNADGQIRSLATWVSSSSYGVWWYYDAAGRLTQMKYPNGLRLYYGYDGHGRVASVTTNRSSWSTLATHFLYQPATDQRYAWKWGNGWLRLVTRDTDGRITRLASASGAAPLRLDFGYNTTNTIRSVTDSVGSSWNASYTYDPNDRLETVTPPGDDQAFAWDRVGNRTAHTRASQSYTLARDPSANRTPPSPAAAAAAWATTTQAICCMTPGRWATAAICTMTSTA